MKRALHLYTTTNNVETFIPFTCCKRRRQQEVGCLCPAWNETPSCLWSHWTQGCSCQVRRKKAPVSGPNALKNACYLSFVSMSSLKDSQIIDLPRGKYFCELAYIFPICCILMAMARVRSCGAISAVREISL